MIHTPFGVIQLMLQEHQQTGSVCNPSVCTKIEFKGYEISIAMDSSLQFGRDLFRSDIRVYKDNKDVSERFYNEGCNMIYGTADELFRVMKQIEAA